MLDRLLHTTCPLCKVLKVWSTECSLDVYRHVHSVPVHGQLPSRTVVYFLQKDRTESVFVHKMLVGEGASHSTSFNIERANLYLAKK
jgi:hypothetical protein